jgi:DNA end-binding protein Ku
MAQQLVESLSAEFDPSKYRDTYREQVQDLIEKKAEGQEIAEVPEPAAAAPVVDLMAALEASLAAARAGKDGMDGEDAEAKESEGGRKKPARRRASA